MLISAKEIIIKTSTLFQNNLKHILPRVAILFAPTVLLSFGGLLALVVKDVTILIVLYVLLFVATGLVWLWALVLIILDVDALLKGEKRALREEANAALARLPSAIGAWLLTGLAVFLGVILFIIPAFIFGIWYAFSVTASVLDGKNSLTALKESKKLVVGRWWPVFWRLAAPTAVWTTLTWVLTLIFVLPVAVILEKFLLKPSTSLVAANALSVIYDLMGNAIGAALMPLFILSTVILYRNLRQTQTK